MQNKYILSLDQGTTSSRAILFDRTGTMVGLAQKEFTQVYPHPGWVEHNPEEIWESQWEALQTVLAQHQVTPEQVAALGVTNQRETTVVWDRHSGKPIYHAIVWQSRQTAEICNDLKEKGYERLIREKTGLLIDAYFSGTKVKWIWTKLMGLERKQKEEIFYLERWILG